jgi:hypothetical protein
LQIISVKFLLKIDTRQNSVVYIIYQVTLYTPICSLNHNAIITIIRTFFCEKQYSINFGLTLHGNNRCRSYHQKYTTDNYLKDYNSTNQNYKNFFSDMNFVAKLGVCFLAIILLILSFAGLASFSLGENFY